LVSNPACLVLYAIHHGLPRPLAEQITAITLAAVTVSIVLHGITVQPMMHLYWRQKMRQAPARDGQWMQSLLVSWLGERHTGTLGF
jgi:NhaP-type Na+/H+ or K+/H+ antiporter